MTKHCQNNLIWSYLCAFFSSYASSNNALSYDRLLAHVTVSESSAHDLRKLAYRNQRLDLIFKLSTINNFKVKQDTHCTGPHFCRSHMFWWKHDVNAQLCQFTNLKFVWWPKMDSKYTCDTISTKFWGWQYLWKTTFAPSFFSHPPIFLPVHNGFYPSKWQVSA